MYSVQQFAVVSHIQRTRSVLVANPKNYLRAVANAACGRPNREKRTKKRYTVVWQRNRSSSLNAASTVGLKQRASRVFSMLLRSLKSCSETRDLSWRREGNELFLVTLRLLRSIIRSILFSTAVSVHSVGDRPSGYC